MVRSRAAHRLDAGAHPLERQRLPRREQVDLVRPEEGAEVVRPGARRRRWWARPRRSADRLDSRPDRPRRWPGPARARPAPRCDRPSTCGQGRLVGEQDGTAGSGWRLGRTRDIRPRERTGGGSARLPAARARPATNRRVSIIGPLTPYADRGRTGPVYWRSHAQRLAAAGSPGHPAAAPHPDGRAARDAASGSSRRCSGKALHNDQLAHERLGKPTALAVFASDALSSTAYASEEILRTLLHRRGAVGLVAFSLLMPDHPRPGGGAGHPDLQLPPDHQGLPVRRRRLHRHQGQPRA